LPDGTITHLITRIKQGGRDAAQGLWQAYSPRLVPLVRARLQSAKGLADEEDAWLAEGPA
jgi:hypothetical protein